MGATQFRLLTTLGLRSNNKLLDFGCGSLRSGKLFIPYLDKGNYFGVEPNKWLIKDGINQELGKTIMETKKPNFSSSDQFEVEFEESFDYAVAQSIFSHTSRNAATKCISSMLNTLSNNGLLALTFVEGKEDYSGIDDWVYPECTTFTRKIIKKILKLAGCKNYRRLPWFHPRQTWWLVAKNSSDLPSYFDTIFLLGGEEVKSTQYKNQHFLANRFRWARSFKGYGG